MHSNNGFQFFLILVLSLSFTEKVHAGFSDGLSSYVKNLGSYLSFSQNPSEELSDEFTQQRIPYEVAIPDEKFISEAAKLTGVALSELDSCQQRVILQLRTDCSKINDEQLAKLAVHLLNCQSYVEGRPVFPCSDEMSIKDCTINMDSDTWTSYHLMSNRARAVCYSIRQVQFRGLAEHTVNRLMTASQEQLKTLGKIADSQENLQDIVDFTLTSLTKGHDKISQQQKDIQMAQFHGQLALEDNLRRLMDEKKLILETHNQLVSMTTKIQHRLEDSSKQMETQVEESRSNHQELIDDLIAIQNKAHIIFQRIEESSNLLIKQNENFRMQYEETLNNLAEVNKTVHNLVSLVGGTRQALEERLAWLSDALGGTDLAVERLYIIIWHSAFLMGAMLTCAFLSARISTRFMVATAPPLNLAASLCNNDKQLGPLELAGVMLGFVIAQTVLLSALSSKKVIWESLTWVKKTSNSKESSGDSITTNDYDKTATETKEYKYTSTKVTSSINDDDDEVDHFDDFGSPTPPLSRSGYLNKSRSRSNTPLLLNGSFRSSCKARTRVGTLCKLSSLPGRDFCYRHQTGDSVIG